MNISFNASLDSENKNSPCFMRDTKIKNNTNNNMNLMDYNYTNNDYICYTIENEKEFKLTKEKNINLKSKRRNNNLSCELIVDNNKNHFYDNQNCSENIIDEYINKRSKEENSKKLLRFSTSIPQKNKLIDKCFQQNMIDEEEKTINNFTINNCNKNLNNKKMTNKNLKSKNNIDDLEFYINKKNNSNLKPKHILKSNNISKKNCTPKKIGICTNQMDKNLNNLKDNQKQEKKTNEICFQKFKNVPSNKIELHSELKLNNLNNVFSKNENQNNFNTSFKTKNKKKEPLENCDSKILMTKMSYDIQRENISDVFCQNHLNEIEFGDCISDFDKFQMNTTQDLINPKKLIFVEKNNNINKSENSLNSKLNKDKLLNNIAYNYNHDDINYNDLNDSLQNSSIKNTLNLSNMANTKLNIDKLNISNHNISRNTSLIEKCNFNNDHNDEEDLNKNNISNIENIINTHNLINRSFKEDKKSSKKQINLNNSSVTNYNPNFKESKLSNDLINKCNTTRHQSGKGNYGINFVITTSNNSIKSNAAINNLNNFKKKVNL